jgi:hypothetical protein
MEEAVPNGYRMTRHLAFVDHAERSTRCVCAIFPFAPGGTAKEAKEIELVVLPRRQAG